MIEHAGEVINLLLWALGALGAIFVALARWIAGMVVRKLDGIEAAIKETNSTIGQATGALRGELLELERRHETRIVEVERRVSDIATRCAIFHEHDKD